MATRKERKADDATNGKVSLPEIFLHWKESAEANRFPSRECEDATLLPNLFAFLSPAVIKDQRYKGEGKPPDCLTEPLLMLSWDRAAGQWAWSLSIKQLNIRLSGRVGNLGGVLGEIERQIQTKEVIVKEIKAL